MNQNNGDKPQVVSSQGRFPANIILDEEAGKMLDEQSGVTKSSGGKGIKSIQSKMNTASIGCNSLTNLGGLGDKGGASRFFYCAKASKKERNRGCEGLEEKKCWTGLEGNRVKIDTNGKQRERFSTITKNHHPTRS